MRPSRAVDDACVVLSCRLHARHCALRRVQVRGAVPRAAATASVTCMRVCVFACASSLSKLLSHNQMAEKKMENIRKYMQLYPEYDWVWVGDSGQVRLFSARDPRAVSGD